MLKRNENSGGNNEVVEEVKITENIANFVDDIPLSKSVKKKKPGIKFIDEE